MFFLIIFRFFHGKLRWIQEPKLFPPVFGVHGHCHFSRNWPLALLFVLGYFYSKAKEMAGRRARGGTRE
jgi:hypothetical protein